MTPAELVREEWRNSQVAAQQAGGLVASVESEEEEEEEESDDEVVDFDMMVEAAVGEMEVEVDAEVGDETGREEKERDDCRMTEVGGRGALGRQTLE